jgi:hypothetical protein
MNKEEHAQKLANKIIKELMDSPLELPDCMAVLATIMVEYAVTSGYEIGAVMNDMERLYDFMARVQPDPSGAVH